ncbi:MAG: hypothetical protein ACM3SO_02595 [Betaproteobacteria bacterium]
MGSAAPAQLPGLEEARLAVPPSLRGDDLKRALESLANEMMLELEAGDADQHGP